VEEVLLVVVVAASPNDGTINKSVAAITVFVVRYSSRKLLLWNTGRARPLLLAVVPGRRKAPHVAGTALGLPSVTAK
jgi:hypothetical protein